MDVEKRDNPVALEADHAVPTENEDSSQAESLALELLSDLISRSIGIMLERARVAGIFKQTSQAAVSSLISSLEIFAFAHSFQETGSTETMNKLMEQPPDVVIDVALARTRSEEENRARSHQLLRLFKHPTSPIRMKLPQLHARSLKSPVLPAKPNKICDPSPSETPSGRKPGQPYSLDTALTKPINLKRLVLCDRKVVALATTSKSPQSHSPMQRRRTKHSVCNVSVGPSVWHAISPEADSLSPGDSGANGSQSIQLQYSIQSKRDRLSQRRDGRSKKVSTQPPDKKPDTIDSLLNHDITTLQDTSRFSQNPIKYDKPEAGPTSNSFLQMSLSFGVKILIEPMQDWSRSCRRPAIYTEHLRHKAIGMHKSSRENQTITSKNNIECGGPSKESTRQQKDRNKHVQQTISRHSSHTKGGETTRDSSATQTEFSQSEDSKETESHHENARNISKRLLQIEALHKEQESCWSDEKHKLFTEIRTLKSKEQETRQQVSIFQKKLNDQAIESQYYRERIKVLEKANEREIKRRFQMEEIMDELKSELDKIRALFIKQERGFQLRERLEKEKSQAIVEKLQLELQETQGQLLHERQERLCERQCHLEEQHNRSEQHINTSEPDAPFPSSPQAANSTLDMSSFLNNSTLLPDRVKKIMEEWRSKMEEALMEAEKPPAEDNQGGRSSSNKFGDVCAKSANAQEPAPADAFNVKALEVREANETVVRLTSDDPDEVHQVGKPIDACLLNQQHRSSTRTLGTNTRTLHNDTGKRPCQAKRSLDSTFDHDPIPRIDEWEDCFQAEKRSEYQQLNPDVRDKSNDGRISYPVLDVIQDSDLQLCKDIQTWYNPGQFSSTC
uniref:AlNc14C3G467 protein n=1 Tax=Albugo laibachii Nc14 TaxID=890382 RepID=F0VZY9_9STRA|nr:AlNc14C3G467 [Albugo laibachii Nc14]|eukprot:CCA14360.1 AlNc14C3G467 [Albugo laibachii Nc14]